MSISAHLSAFGLGLSINDGDTPNLSIGHVHVWLVSPVFSVVWLGKFDFIVERKLSPSPFFRLDTYRASEDVCGGSFMGFQWQLVKGETAPARL